MTSPSLISCGKNYAIGAAGVALFVFMASLLFAPFYVSGDQVFYQLTYENMADRNLIEAYSLYPKYTSSSEFGHFFITWLASGFGIEKNLVMAVVNSLLAFFLMKLFEKWRVSLFVASTICITNFYMLVLYFAAERLKFSVLFFVMSAYYLQNKKTSYAFSLLAIFSHVQILIMYAALLSPKFFLSDFFRTGSISKQKSKGVLVSTLAFVTAAILIWIFMGYQISSKIEYYVAAKSGERIPLEFLQAISIFCLTLLYTKKRAEAALTFIPIFIAISLIGGENVNLFAFAIFIFYASRYRRGLNYGILICSIYFSYKSVGFIGRTIATGQGF
jgi:hypothetical protein